MMTQMSAGSSSSAPTASPPPPPPPPPPALALAARWCQRSAVVMTAHASAMASILPSALAVRFRRCSAATHSRSTPVSCMPRGTESCARLPGSGKAAGAPLPRAAMAAAEMRARARSAPDCSRLSSSEARKIAGYSESSSLASSTLRSSSPASGGSWPSADAALSCPGTGAAPGASKAGAKASSAEEKETAADRTPDPDGASADADAVKRSSAAMPSHPASGPGPGADTFGRGVSAEASRAAASASAAAASCAAATSAATAARRRASRRRSSRCRRERCESRSARCSCSREKGEAAASSSADGGARSA